jgi:choline-sulfatase
MSYFEHASRIPLIMSGPALAAGSTIDAHVGLLDVAPTLLDIAGIDVPPIMDGATVLPLIGAPADPERTVFGEYLGEGAVAPIFMIRRGPWKFVWSQPDGAQLFDLETDPHELTDLVGDADFTDVVVDFTTEVLRRWDPADIEADVRASQQDRVVVDRAMRQGRFSPWDFQPMTDATNQYMRNHLDLNDVEAGRRA